MKSLTKLFVFIIIVALFSACNPDDEKSVVELLTAHTWNVTAIKSQGVNILQMYPGVSGSIEFKKEQTVEIKFQVPDSMPMPFSIEGGKWTLSQDEKTIYIEQSDSLTQEMNINAITESDLILSTVYEFNGIPMSIVIECKP